VIQPQATGSSAGVTLIELMIVIVILAILAGVALPAYQDSMQKSRRSDAYAVLLDVASRQEQHQLDRGTYTTTFSELGYPDGRISSGNLVSEEEYYAVAAATCPAPGTIANCFVLTATAASDKGQNDDTTCNRIILKSNGSKASKAKGSDTEVTDGRCW
jgi:type IV pilus assembly protein PilE